MPRFASLLAQLAVVVALITLVGLGSAFFARHQILRFAADLPQFTHDIGEKRDVRVEMRDGIQLTTQVILPEGKGPWPAVVIRNPYNLLNAFTLVCELFARYGYACVHQDVRGRMGSQGEWSPMIHEREDGFATFAWLRKQPFQNGRWALFGMSYLAAVQWAVADALPDEVQTMVSMVFGVDTHGVMYERGLFRHDVFSAWAALMPDERLALWNGSSYARMIRHRPARRADEAELGRSIPWYRAWVDAASADDPLWSEGPFLHFLEAPTRVRVPVLMLGGYYDPFFDAQRRDFERLSTRAHSKLVIGPWQHLQQDAADFALPQRVGLGGQWRIIADWLDQHLRDAPPRQAVGVIENYDMGAGGWRRRLEFPPRPDRQIRFHLVDLADSADCPGGLLTRRTEFVRESAATFTYDPDDPYPSQGGAAALSFAFRTFPSVEPGARRRSPRCERHDVLRFVSEPLEEALHLAGSPRAYLRVSSSATATAFGFELAVSPPDDPSWYHVRESFGALSLPVATSTHSDPATGFEVEAWPIEWTFAAGARLKVEVRSSSFPLYSAHPNLPGPWGEIEAAEVAQQQLHPGSFIDLPVRAPAEPVISAADLGTVQSSMACSFDIELPGSAADIIQRAQRLITDAGGSFRGDDAAGDYRLKLAVGAVEGSYAVNGSSIRFDITKKPMLVPCGTIESFLRERFRSA